MDANKAWQIKDDFSEYSRTRNIALIKKYNKKDLESAKGYLHKQYGNTIWYNEIEKRIEGLGKNKCSKFLKWIFYLFTAVLIYFLGNCAVQEYNKYKDSIDYGITDKQYKKKVKDELERNIRVLQFYVWCLHRDWRGYVYVKNNAGFRYLNFHQNKQDKLKAVYDIAVFIDIEKAYNDCDIASKKIENINAGLVRPEEKEQYIESLTLIANEIIDVIKRIDESVEENIKHLSGGWNSLEILEDISKEFLKSEKIRIASDEVATFDVHSEEVKIR